MKKNLNIVKSKVISPDYHNKPAVVIGSGPSLVQDDINYCSNKAYICAVNSEYLRAPFADFLFAADANFWNYSEAAKLYCGEKWTVSFDAARQWNLNYIPALDRPGFSTDPRRLHTGGNSGFMAVNLMLLYGFSPIILLGFDMQFTDGLKHHFGSHEPFLDRDMSVEIWRYKFDVSAKAVNCLINCSRETALENVPRQKLRDVL